MKKVLMTVLTGVIISAVCNMSAMASKKTTITFTGRTILLLDKVYALDVNGSPINNSSITRQCKKHFSMKYGTALALDVEYTINPQYLYMTAQASYAGTSVPLYPLGTKNTDGAPYQFSSDDSEHRVFYWVYLKNGAHTDETVGKITEPLVINGKKITCCLSNKTSSKLH